MSLSSIITSVFQILGICFGLGLAVLILCLAETLIESKISEIKTRRSLRKSIKQSIKTFGAQLELELLKMYFASELHNDIKKETDKYNK